MDLTDLNELRSVELLANADTEAVEAIRAIDAEYKGLPLPAERQEDYAQLVERRKEIDARVREITARESYIASMADSARHTERVAETLDRTTRPSLREQDIFDTTTIDRGSKGPQAWRDRAMRAVEIAQFPHPSAQREKVQEHVQQVIDSARDYESPAGSEIARRILHTGNPLYKRAFGKYLTGASLTTAEQNILADTQRALSVGTGSAGGFALVYQLDPTVVPTSNFSVNPYRAISRTETISGTNEYKFLTSGAITAAYAAEATEASDNAPTLAQPDIIVEKAQAYVPFSIEAGQDWTGLQGEMARLLQDAKDDLEATKFTTGAGHGSQEPKGIITAATNTTTAGGAAAFAIADLYKVWEALPPRFRPTAQWVANLFIWDKVRQFDTAGGSGVWQWDAILGLGAGLTNNVGSRTGNLGGRLLGKPGNEATAMGSVLTTGTKILLVGEFSYFVIVDRVGMNIEIMPLVVGTNHRPTGQRGLYAYWRNSSDVLSAAAFQVLVTG